MTIATVLHEEQSPTIDCPDSRYAASHQGPHEKGVVVNDSEESAVCSNTFASDHTHRKLKPRHIQLIGIGGTIGTALYVQIGKGLMHGGPGSLFLAFLIWLVSHYCCQFVFILPFLSFPTVTAAISTWQLLSQRACLNGSESTFTTNEPVPPPVA
ncbi:hypothetical protein BO86DRAFT_11360 [Aspergillus japonicus CBS 114.51]|uniref:Amino acid permease/ SLC12A domain-containing protein n=1 Tax=Aspergillus japonicus CBS 114.51 TaxID=1448312 RepID=A0A8T8X7D7_ASPJA|nr:hypothetical protein BO86DRAFT_11360 [Aspergillus japonicus CBS 114.51]RAH84067.1 hypothetical protein BO86DRAFT_11360 [Aspergillus japonicus CBS 114.51]